MQITPRFKTADSFWFTFFHELGHIILHNKKLDFTDTDSMEKDQEETEADTFACDTLIPREFLKELENTKKLKIISPFITDNMVTHLLNNWDGNTIQVITRFNLNDFRSGVSSLKALKKLIASGAQVVMEAGAGIASGIADAAYEAAGVMIASP